MEQELFTRLRIAGEMAEKYFPPGFVSEVLDLVRSIPVEDKIGVLNTYDFFLETQRKYQDLAHRVHRELMIELAGGSPQRLPRLDYLVEEAAQTYPDEYVNSLHRALRLVELKPSQHYDQADLDSVMEAVTELTFVMNDSPSYPTERALKFYQFIYAAGRLQTMSPRSILQQIMPHAVCLKKSHERLVKA